MEVRYTTGYLSTKYNKRRTDSQDTENEWLRILTITTCWQSLLIPLPLGFLPRAGQYHLLGYSLCTNTKHHYQWWTNHASQKTWWNIRWPWGLETPIAIDIQWPVATPWTPAWPNTLEGKCQQMSGLQSGITQLTISHISIDPLFHVENVWNDNNEGECEPDHENHEHRDISWYVPTEHKHAKCVHRNSLYVP